MSDKKIREELLMKGLVRERSQPPPSKRRARHRRKLRRFHKQLTEVVVVINDAHDRQA